jgi:uncharacterized repeat protein (TIGR01451 family)
MTKNRTSPKPRSARDIRRKLRSIYEGVDGNIPDLTKLDRAGRSKLTGFLIKMIGLLAVLSAIAWGGFFVFSGGFFGNDETLKLTIEGPDEIKSGEEVAYTLRYENVGDVPVASLIATLNIPTTFHVYSTVPEADENLEWTIGSLSAGSDGAITITGVFLAEVPSSQRLQALFNYKPANFSSDFQDIVTQKVDIEDSVVALSFTGPEKALAGDTSEYVVNIQNTGREPIYNLRVTPSLSQDFTILSSDPQLEEGQSYWTVPTLDPGMLEAITIQGSFTSTASGEQTMVASVGFVDQETVYTQKSEKLITDVLGGSIAFSVIVNGSTQSQTADLGETLRISLDYVNNSQETVKDMSFAMTLSSENGTVPIDWSNANLGDGSRSGNEVYWEGLAKLAPESSAVIDLSLPISSELDSSQADTFTIAVVLTLGNIGSVSSTRTLEATPIVVTLNSDVTVNVQARYYADSGAVIGSGPLPPEVGETTRYRVYWNLSNSLHTLEDIQMSATLPQDVAWLENTDTDIGTLSYNATTRQIIWTIPKLLTEIGHAGAWFEIAVNPGSEDTGRFIKLTSATSFQARDTSTEESLSRSINELTSELPDDDFGLGKGIVID